jgi:hypothetical protein
MEVIERIPLANLHYLNSLTFTEFKQYSKKGKNEEERKLQYQNLPPKRPGHAPTATLCLALRAYCDCINAVMPSRAGATHKTITLT